MEAPAIHYDTILGANPVWKSCISEGLKGNLRPFGREELILSHGTPSGVYFLHAALAYAKAGQQVFCVGPRLQQMLTDTDVSKVPEDFLKFPYPCVYVATPDCPWEIFGGITGMHQVGGFYMYQKSARELLFAIWGKANENSQATDDDATFWLLLDLDKVPRTSDTTGVTLMDFEAYLNQVLSDASADASDPALQVDPEDAIATAKDAMFLVRLGLNLVLYLNSLKVEKEEDHSFRSKRKALIRGHKDKMARTKSPGKRKKAERQFEKALATTSEAMIVWIGKSFEESPLKDGNVVVRPEGTGRAWTTRRGHFHYYWTGPRKADDGQWRRDPLGNRIYGDSKVLKWVAPVYRDFSAVLESRGKQYRFREERKDYPVEE